MLLLKINKPGRGNSRIAPTIKSHQRIIYTWNKFNNEIYTGRLKLTLVPQHKQVDVL